MIKKYISFSPPDITEAEINEVVKTMKSGWITTGPRTKLFEREIAEYSGTEKAVCLNSATACLESVLRLLDVGEGDEVITSAYTYSASASPVLHVGAKLVLVDVSKNSYEMDYSKLEEAITEKTKVVIPVDIGGVMCDYKKMFAIIERQKTKFRPSNQIQRAIGRVVVVADSAHAFGAKKLVDHQWKVCGSVADFTSFSFHAVKNLTTAEGGAVTWKKIHGIDNEWIYNQFMLLSLHGQSKDALAKTELGQWEYDIVSLGYKCNMTDIMAAIGLQQLKRYSVLLEKRSKVIQEYNIALQKLGVEMLLHKDEGNLSSGHLYLMRIPWISETIRNEIIVKLAEFGIATNVHYKPLPMMTGYKKLGFKIEDFPNSYAQYCNEITLPLHTCLSTDDIEYIVGKLTSVLEMRG